MVNAPSVKIEFLTDYELTFTSSSQKHTQCNISNLNKDRTFKGKKGLHLCGGSVNETTGEVSGCVLDGTYTFYRSASGAYDGFLGDCLSNDDYSFSVPQFITFQAKNSGCFIKSIMIYFDGISNEFPTELYFSNAKNADGATVSKYNSSYRIKNNKLTFMYSFGEDSQITEITLNVSKWSKKKSFVKILKIKTGYTGLYDYSAIQSLKWDNDKFSDENELTFGISSNKATIEINDSDDIIDELYAKGVAAGALGGKLLGAGGGGFLVFYVQPERQDAVRWAMRDLMHIPFAFEDGGTRVIHYTPETYEPRK